MVELNDPARKRSENAILSKQLFDSAVSQLLTRNSNYVRPPWIKEGPLWVQDAEGVNRIVPNRYDPAYPWISRGEVYINEKNPGLLLENPYDLDNLRIIDKDRVLRFLNNLEELVADPDSEGKEIIAMINSGGTVMMKPDEKGELKPGLSGRELLDRLGGQITSKFAVATMDLPTTIDSSQMEIDFGADLVITMAYLWENASESLKQRLNGIAIAHGTDTMAGSSSHIAMMLGSDLPFPVGIFGAQKTVGDTPTDVQANTVTTLEALKRLKKDRINTVFVAMGGTSGGAYLAVGVDKMNDDKVESFGTPAHPKILDASNFFANGSRFDFTGAYIGLQPGRQTATMRSTGKKWFPIISRGYSPVLSITPKMGHDPDVIRRIVAAASDLKYVSVTTFGSFTMNDKIREAVLSDPGIQDGSRMLIAANPFPEGSTEHKYEPALRMYDSGLIVPTAVLPIALEAKLMLANRVIADSRQAKIEFLNGTDYVGEQPVAYWRSLSSQHDVQIGLPHGFPTILHRGKIPQE